MELCFVPGVCFFKQVYNHQTDGVGDPFVKVSHLAIIHGERLGQFGPSAPSPQAETAGG